MNYIYIYIYIYSYMYIHTGVEIASEKRVGTLQNPGGSKTIEILKYDSSQATTWFLPEPCNIRV